MNSKLTGIILITAMGAASILNGCGASNTVKGGAVGAGAGGVIGGIIGHQTGNKTTGAIIGAAVGGTAGALIGRNMDKQAEEMRQQMEDAKVERIGEGIQVTYGSGVLFRTNSATLSAEAQQNIRKMAEILQKYPDTDIIVAGHTDSDGTEEYNQGLSERRAKSVTDYVTSLGVSAARFQSVGYGETQPVATNDTAAGKQANRRVEIAIMANEKMKQAAQEGKL